VRPSPPLQNYADVVQHTVQAMAMMGFSGHETIAQTLAGVGWRLSRSTVARHLKKPKPATETHDPRPAECRVQVKYVNHIWMMDFTVAQGLFGLQQLVIATILDVRSRFPVAVRVFESGPSAEQAVAVVEAAIRTHGRPRHFVSDQGARFTAEAVRQRLDALRIKLHFGAVGKHGSIGIIDRFFRTIKDRLVLRTWKALLREDLEGDSISR
jgi:transposase InsO family protein